MKLNDSQEAAASHVDGPCLVVAVPGSGKTRLLVERVARMIAQGIPANRIVCVTFTNKAATEMKERICKRLGESKPPCFVGTFHRLCVGLLRKFGNKIGYSEKFTILDTDDQKDMIRQIARQLDKHIEKNEVGLLLKAYNDYRENMWDRNKLYDAVQQNDDWIHIGDTYIERMKESQMIDFSGLLSETIRLLDEHPDITDRVQEAFKYLQVDEVQDTNFAQFYLINKFSAKWRNIMMVGDISQSIYRFRGARYQNIQDFVQRHPDCKKVELSLNYRSTPQIIKAADTLIRHNTSHMAEKFETLNPDGEAVRVLPFANQFDEADFVTRQIKRVIAAGWSPKDVAILYRMNAMSEPLERALAGEGIQYEVIGSKSFYDRREVKDCIAMLRFASNPKDGIAFHRCASLIDGLGDTTVGKIEKIAQDKNITLIEACDEFMAASKTGAKSNRVVKDLVDKISFDISSLNVRDCLDEMVKRFEYNDFLEKEYGVGECFDRHENVKQLIESAGKFAAEHQLNSIDGYLQMISLMSASDKKAEGETVSMMSLHAAKGLEFPIVFMVGVEQNILPHGMSMQEDPFEGTEEERRLCYVGMTRAKNQLIMSHCKQRRAFGAGGMAYNKLAKPSQFLFEAGLLKAGDKIRI